MVTLSTTGAGCFPSPWPSAAGMCANGAGAGSSELGGNGLAIGLGLSWRGPGGRGWGVPPDFLLLFLKATVGIHATRFEKKIQKN